MKSQRRYQMNNRNRFDNRQQTNSRPPNSGVHVLVFSLLGIAFFIIVGHLLSEQQGEKANWTHSDRFLLDLFGGSLTDQLDQSDNTLVPLGSVPVSNDSAEFLPGGQPVHRIEDSNYSRGSDQIGRTEERGQSNEAQSNRYGNTVMVPLFPILLINLILIAILWDTVRQALEVARVRIDRS